MNRVGTNIMNNVGMNIVNDVGIFHDGATMNSGGALY
jgi:hypothetical protein